MDECSSPLSPASRSTSTPARAAAASRGFSLVEVMLATTVLGTASLAALAALLFSYRTADSNLRGPGGPRQRPRRRRAGAPRSTRVAWVGPRCRRRAFEWRGFTDGGRVERADRRPPRHARQSGGRSRHGTATRGRAARSHQRTRLRPGHHSLPLAGKLLLRAPHAPRTHSRSSSRTSPQIEPGTRRSTLFHRQPIPLVPAMHSSNPATSSALRW